MKKIRLDKYLADMGAGSRSEVKDLIRKGRITVNSLPAKSPEDKIEPGTDEVLFDLKPIGYEQHRYYMLNKPAGVVSATRDRREKTVLDLIPEKNARNFFFPVGRLDKDTEGLLLITNDGGTAHQLLSPKRHVPKVYYARIEGRVEEETIDLFREGLAMEEEFTAMPSELVILTCGEVSEVHLTIYEGKYHQVKRMFEAVGKKVIYLKRLSMGEIELDASLAPGEYRLLTEEEMKKIKGGFHVK